MENFKAGKGKESDKPHWRVGGTFLLWCNDGRGNFNVKKIEFHSLDVPFLGGLSVKS
jgi:hypothetical protein